MKLMRIEWFDAYTPPCGWQEQDEVIEEVVKAMNDYCVSIGYLIHEDTERIILASSTSGMNATASVDGIIGIPKQMIRSQRELV